MTVDLICRYWGKARKPDELDGDEYHLLPYHSLDVASVAAYWWDLSPGLRRLFCVDQQLDERHIRAWVLFFAALHDLGKFDIRFQYKAQHVWQLLNPDSRQGMLNASKESRGYDHGAAGLYWFIKDFQRASAVNTNPFGALSEPSPHPFQAWFPWMEAVCGHHGSLKRVSDVTSSLNPTLYKLPLHLQLFAKHDKHARQEWINIAADLFLSPVGLTQQDHPPACSILLAGFISVADWLGSWLTNDTFRYCSRPALTLSDLQKYYADRYRLDAARAVAKGGLVEAVRSGAGVQALLDDGYQPRQLQVLVDSLPLETGLTLIEAPTGSGKTEAAMAYAWRLLEENLADSIIFALPTQATANAMLQRVYKLAHKLFNSPNLILAHGYASFNALYQDLKLRGRNIQTEDAWSQCCEWLSQSRKRVFLGQIGVCTIDQVLISVLPLRHNFVRGFGVGRSVLIVDEVHAYDRYMYGLLDAVLRNKASVGSPVILLSATLPQQQKRQLLAGYGTLPGGAGEDNNAADLPYPLVSWINGPCFKQFDLQSQPHQQPARFSLFLEPYYTSNAAPDAALLERLLNAAEAGAQVCLICNLVDIAQQTYQRLKTSASTNIDVLLFHARFNLLDRQTKENAALACFGKEGDRSHGRILVSTQVIESSVDVDFDWLVTQHCPVDLLFQRLGRLHRHQRANRPKGFEKPNATVLLPDSEGYGLHGKIYGHTRVMWRTQQYIEALRDEPINFPAAYRAWIEPIYSEEAIEPEPEWVVKGMEKFENDTFTKGIKARQMLDWTEHAGFKDTESNERAVTRDGDMSVPLVPYIQTAVGRQLLDGRVYEQLEKFNQHEALALNQVNVPASWGHKLDMERDEFGRVWLEGTAGNGGIIINHKQLRMRYTKERGMEKIDESAD